MPNKNSKKTALKKAIKIALGCCFSLFASDSLLAQDSDPNLQDVEVVTVKGQKRDTLLQNADVAVTVFTSEYIENSRIRGLRRIDDLLPNVQFNQSGQTSSVFATIRGIESSQDIVNRAGLYIDGIPFRELNNSVLDQIESIEVLRGPQSTLYGANTEAGLFIVTSRKPQDYFEADIRLTNSYFNDENAYGVSSFLGGPIIDQQLKGSIVLNYSKEDAFLQNPFAPNISTAEIRESFVQGNLIYTPNDTLTVRSTFYIIETDAPGLYESEFVPLDRSAFDDNIFFNPFTQTVEGSFRELFHEGRNIGDFEFFSDVPKQTNEQDIVFGLGIEQALDFGSLDLAFSYAKLDEDSTGLDTDISAFRFQSGFAADFKETWSGEATFTSLDSDRFEYLFGISWYKEDRSFTRDISFFNPITNDYDGFGNVPELFAFAEDYAIFGSTTFGL
ncbi:MAG: TonB-dependent receptor plug domain-containing protein, partial [Pseudomonadota bacterium]